MVGPVAPKRGRWMLAAALLVVASGLAVSRLTVPFVTETRFGSPIDHVIECPRVAWTMLGADVDLPSVYSPDPGFWRLSANQACGAAAGGRASMALIVMVAAALVAPWRLRTRIDRPRLAAAGLLLTAAFVALASTRPTTLLDAHGDQITLLRVDCDAAAFTMLGSDVSVDFVADPPQTGARVYAADPTLACRNHAGIQVSLALAIVLAAALVRPTPDQEPGLAHQPASREARPDEAQRT